MVLFMEVGQIDRGADRGVGEREDKFGFGPVDFEGLGDIPMICPLGSETQAKAPTQNHTFGIHRS